MQIVRFLLFSDDESHYALEVFAVFRISLSIVSVEVTYAEGFLSGVETAPVEGVAISVDLRESGEVDEEMNCSW